MERFLNFIVIVSFLTLSNIFANKPIFQISPENKNYLRYFQLKNEFNNSQGIYKFGEVQLICNDSYKLINLIRSLDTFELKKTSLPNVQGTNFHLQSICKTENFVIPKCSSLTIKYFRQFNEFIRDVRNESNISREEMDFVERTEFLLQLVNAKTDEVIAILDSVVLMPNGNMQTNSLFGTNPQKLFHKWIVPTNFCDKFVYLRISPRCHGFLNKEIEISEIDFWVDSKSLADLYDDNSGSNNQNELDSLYWIELCLHLDSIDMETGELPKLQYHIPQNRLYEFRNKYQSDWDFRIFYGDTIYSKRIYNTAYKKTSNEMNDLTSEESLMIKKIRSDGDSLFIEVTSLINTWIKFKLRKFYDKDIIEIWNGAIVKGENKIDIDITKLSTGKYSIIIDDINNHHVIMRCEYDVVK